MRSVLAENEVSLSTSHRPSDWRGFWFIVLVAIYWTACAFPSPGAFLRGRDAGYQLAGAVQIVAGIHPYVGFPESYGPLAFYASAWAQMIFADRIIGEMALCSLGFGLGYGMMYILIQQATGRRLLALAAVILALGLLPPIYIYYLILGPLLVLFVSWQYFRVPSRGRFWTLAVAVAVCGLFRPDFGVYTWAAAAVGFAMAESHWKARCWSVTRFGLAVLAA